MFYMASPWDGAPKALMVLMNGLEAMGLKRFNLWDLGPRMQKLVRTFPSYYQLIPHKNPFLRNEDNEVVDLFNDTRSLDNDAEKAMLADARPLTWTWKATQVWKRYVSTARGSLRPRGYRDLT